MITRFSLIMCSTLVLCACGEKAQTLGTQHDAPAYGGAKNNFITHDWQVGDKNSWEQHLRARGQYGMNDHSRAP